MQVGIDQFHIHSMYEGKTASVCEVEVQKLLADCFVKPHRGEKEDQLFSKGRQIVLRSRFAII